MAELTPAEEIILNMLGDDLKVAVVDARDRLGDDTVMARIYEGLVVVERAGAEVASGMIYEDAVAHLAGLK